MTIKDILRSNEIIEPETIRTLFPVLTDLDIEKINATRTILHTKFFFEDMYIFEDIVLALNGEIPDFTYLQGVSPEQIWYAVDLVSNKLRPGIEYSWEVQAYCKWMFNNDGVYIYPEQFTDLQNPYFNKAKKLAGQEEFDENTPEGIQASKYKVIQTYINRMNNKNLNEWR